MAIKANFTAGLLSVTGDNGDDAIAITGTRDATTGQIQQILINGGAISVQGDPLTNANEIDVFGGNGNDTIIWNPGDGSDTIEGEAGFDTLLFNGNGANEQMTISANGNRATLFRTQGNVSMDLNSVERIQLDAFGGADTITVKDLTGTDVKQVAIDLGGGDPDGNGDG